MLTRNVLMILLILPVLWACDDLVHEKGNGNLTTEERTVGPFNELSLMGNYQVFLNDGPTPRLTIEADENLHEFIEVAVADGQLQIENSRKISSKDGVKIYLNYTQLDKISSSGASVVKTESVLKSQSLQVFMPGAGVLDLQLEVQNLEIDVSGACLVQLEGWAQHQDITMSGIGNLEAYELRSRTCKVMVSGVGGAQVHASEKLTANINGIGGIKYKGNPSSVQENVSGLGKIKPADPEEAN